MKTLPTVLTPSITPLQQAKKWLIEDRKLSPDLLAHSERVGQTARGLGKRFGFAKPLKDKLEIAGLLHDCAKEIPNNQMLKLADENQIEILNIDKRFPNELHARVGATLVRQELMFDKKEEEKPEVSLALDENIIAAIRSHSFGEVTMNQFEKIILIADDIEPERDADKRKMILDALGENIENIDEALKIALEIKLNKTRKRREPIHPLLYEIWNHFVSL